MIQQRLWRVPFSLPSGATAETREELEQVIEAAGASWVDGIRYCGTDPDILARFREKGCESLCDAVCTR